MEKKKSFFQLEAEKVQKEIKKRRNHFEISLKKEKKAKREFPLEEEIEGCSNCGSKEPAEEVCFETFCPDCGLFRDDVRLVDDLYNNYKWLKEDKDNTNSKKRVIYNTMNYLEKILNNIQSIDRTKIPNEIIEGVRGEVKKINYLNVRKYLKKNKLSNYYQNIYLIIFEATGVRIIFPEELLQNLRKGIQISIFEWFVSPLKNTVKKFLPIQFVCIELLLHLDKLFELPYKVHDYLCFFKNLKRKRKNQNQGVLRELFEQINFASHFQEYVKVGDKETNLSK